MATEGTENVVPPAAPEMPEMTGESVSASVSASASLGTEVPETQVERVIYWRDPIFTGTIFVVVNVLCFLTLFLKYSFLSVFSYALMVFLVVCFVYINASKLLVGHLGEDKLPKPTFGLEPFSAEALHAKVDPAVDALNGFVEGARDIALCKNNVTTLKVIGGVFLAYQIGKFIPDLVLFYMLFLALFIMPKIYELNKDEIDKVAADAQVRMTEEKDKYMKIANERTVEYRDIASKKFTETATPIYDKMKPKLEELRKRVTKGGATAEPVKTE